MNINLTILGQAISFGIFVWFCMRYVWPPLIKVLEERAETIADGLVNVNVVLKSWKTPKGKLSCYSQKAERRHLNSSTKLKDGRRMVNAKSRPTEADKIKSEAQTEMDGSEIRRKNSDKRLQI